jgi:putative flippase GtrA
MHPLLAKPQNSLPQLARSAAASLIGFCADIGLLAALVEGLRVPYLLAGALSFVAGTALVYLLSATWIFPQRRFATRKLEFLFFLGAAALGLGLNALCMAGLTELLGIHYLVSKILSGLAVFSFNFSARKFFIFSPGKGGRPAAEPDMPQ